MKITRCLALLAGSTLLVTSAMAQSQLSFDGIAASPRLRQMMEDQRAPLPAMGGTEFVADESLQGQLVVAPPRAREQIMEQQEEQRTAAIVLDSEPQQTFGNQVTRNGITAPPRAHQMLEDQRQMVEIYQVR